MNIPILNNILIYLSLISLHCLREQEIKYLTPGSTNVVLILSISNTVILSKKIIHNIYYLMADISYKDSLFALLYFVILTIVYFILKLTSTTKKMIMIWMGVYFLALLIGEFFINVSVSSKLCGNAQYGMAAIITIIPWIIIFGFLNFLLISFPGWISPFSNTFGYLVTKLMGIGDLLNNILSAKFEKEGAPDNMKVAAEALEHIYADKSLLINEITQENFDTFWSRMSGAGLFKKGADEFKDRLRYLVRVKDIVAEFIWYVLTGGLVTSVSYNYMVNSECTRTVDELETNASASQSTITETKEQKIYKSF